jgi:hypothetical protein
MIRSGAILLAMVFFAGGVVGQTRRAEEQPLQDEKIFQQLLSDYHLLARLLIHQNRAQEGIPILRNIYELSFGPAPLAIELCDALDKAGQPSETIGILRAQMLREPLNEAWGARLITACERSKKWEEVIQLRLDLRKKHPTDLDNLAGLAEAYRQVGKEKEAGDIVDKIALTARDKLFIFGKAPAGTVDPRQDQIDADGFAALKLQRQLDLQDDFEQYAAGFVLRQKKRDVIDTVLGWLRENPPTVYMKSVFPDQQAVGLWIGGRLKESATILEAKFPPRQYPGADHLLVRYYTAQKQPERIEVRFGKELPDYLKEAEKPQPPVSVPAPAPVPPPPVSPPSTNSAPAVSENPDGDIGDTPEEVAP